MGSSDSQSTIPHIIVTTDLSPESTIAFGHALDRFRQHQGAAQLTVLHILEDIVQATFGLSLGGSSHAILDDLERQAEVRLEMFRKHFFTGIVPLLVVMRGSRPVATEIADFARSRHATLLVTASHGRSGLAHAVFGSVAERLVRSLPCPLLVVPVTDEALRFVREQGAEFWK